MIYRVKWLGLFRGADGRSTAWRSPYYPGITVRRCARLTALRRYYVQGLPITRRFWNWEQAQTAVEQYLHGSTLATTPESLRCPACNEPEVSMEQRQRDLKDGRLCNGCGGCGWMLKTELVAAAIRA
jgi:hypothetical protein